MMRLHLCLSIALWTLCAPRLDLTAGESDKDDVTLDRPWETCLAELRKAASFAHAGRVDEATATLEAAGRTLQPPYAARAASPRFAVQSVFEPRANLSHSHCERRASLMADLGDCKLAARWAREAVSRKNPSTYVDHARLAWYLAAAGDDKAALAEYERAERLATDAPDFWKRHITRHQEMIRRLINDPEDFSIRLDFLRIHYLAWNKSTGYGWQGGAERRLLALDKLLPQLEMARTGVERRSVYEAICHCLKTLGDAERETVWEQRMLAEDWATPDDAALAAAKRAGEAYRQKDYVEAERLWRKIVKEYPASRMYGAAMFNIGYVLQSEGKHDAAIEQYEKLFASALNDRDPGASIMETYRNYRHRSAEQISQCYEAQGEIAPALEWMLRARDKYPYQSWCGTCAQQDADQIANTLVRLFSAVNRHDEALSIAEELVFGDWHDVDLEVAAILIQQYSARGRADELRVRLEKHPDAPLERTKAFWERHRDYGSDNAQAEAQQLVVDCLPILDAAAREDRDKLWRLTQDFRVSALGASFPHTREEIAAGLAAERLLADPGGVIPLLKEKLKGGDRARAWAILLLARLGTVKNVEAIHQMVQRVTDGKTSRDRQVASECREDHLYAILLADPDARETVLERYASGPLRDAAKHVLERTRSLDGTRSVPATFPNGQPSQRRRE